MRKWFLALAFALAFLTVGCAGGQKQTVSEQTQVKCPKCGAEFTVQEGREGGK